MLTTRCVEDAVKLGTRLNELGLAWHRRRDYAASASLFRAATRVNPASNAARFNLACAHARAGALDDAIATLTALREHPDAARWHENAARDPDLASIWRRPGAWKALTERGPWFLDSTHQHEAVAGAVVAITLPPIDASLAWQDVTLTPEQTRALLVPLNAVGEGGGPRYGFRVRITGSRSPFPLFALPPLHSEVRHVPESALAIVRRPAVWQPEAGVRVLVLPLRATNAYFDREGLAAFELTDAGAVFRGLEVDNTLENHGADEETEVVVMRNRSAVGTGTYVDGALMRRFLYVRDGRFFWL